MAASGGLPELSFEAERREPSGEYLNPSSLTSVRSYPVFCCCTKFALTNEPDG